jgi:hypothetical protein
MTRTFITATCMYTQAIRPVTRLALEGTLYQLTVVGGPRYLPRSVNTAAFLALDGLFPRGQWSRRLVSWSFRFIHPTEWCCTTGPAVLLALLSTCMRGRLSLNDVFY